MSFKMKRLPVLAFIMLLSCCSCSARYGLIRPIDPARPHNLLGTYSGIPNSDGFYVINVTGKGIAPIDAVNRGQAILMAERAAVADGYRKLVERIKGLYVEANSSVGNVSISSERIRLESESWIRGAEIVNVRQVEFGITEADMRIRILLDPSHIPYQENNATLLSNYMQ